MLSRAAEWVWFGGGPFAALARAALTPIELAYAGAVGMRARMYDAGRFPSFELALPSVSVGNLTVGGTGKTPVAAWIATRLLAMGGRPAIVMRGYGADEPLVHATLNPTVPVIVAADRLYAVARARDLHDRDVAVLDDAFQHMRARRLADIVLVSADRWTPRARLLPAGPFREPLAALRRASLVLVTRKATSLERAAEVLSHVGHAAPDVPVGIVQLAAGDLRSARGDGPRPLSVLHGTRVFAVCAVGDPSAFLAQLRALGAVVDAVVLPDHHAFHADETAALARRAERAELAVCTLKDAVKLAVHWPRAAPPLWYVSQRVAVERGGEALDALLAGVLAARPA